MKKLLLILLILPVFAQAQFKTYDYPSFKKCQVRDSMIIEGVTRINGIHLTTAWDSSNYKIAVLNSSNVLFKMNWPVTPVLISGTYTPTLTNTLNIASSTAFVCQYMRVGTVVTVSGKVSITESLATQASVLTLTLPIASALTAEEQCVGVACSFSSPTPQSGSAAADITNDKVFLKYVAGDASAHTVFFTFTYQIL